MKSILWSFMWNLQNHSCIKCSGFAPGDEHMNICSLGPVWYTTCFHVRIKVVRCKMLTSPLLINQPMGQEHLYQRFYPGSVHFATQKWMQLPNCSLNPIRTHIKHIKIPWNSSLKFIKTSGVFHVFHAKAQQGVGNEARAADEMHLLLAQLPIWEALKDPGWIYPSEKKRMIFCCEIKICIIPTWVYHVRWFCMVLCFIFCASIVLGSSKFEYLLAAISG